MEHDTLKLFQHILKLRLFEVNNKKCLNSLNKERN